MAISAELRARIQSDFPAFASLLDIPDVANLLVKAAEQGWDIGKLQANLYATSWWKHNTESQRNAQILYRTDRASYEREADKIRRTIQIEAMRIGSRLTSAEIMMLSRRAFNEGWLPEEITRQIVTVGARRETGVGQISRDMDLLRAMSRNYGIGVSTEWVKHNARRIAMGELNMDGLQSWFNDHARVRFKDNELIQRGLQEGRTVMEIVEPTLNLVADELELGAVGWDLNQGIAQKVLNYKDVDTGQMRPMTDAEAVQLARSDRRWRDTNKGKAMTTDLTNAISRKMGVAV
jgi:hypothetical protein